MTKTKMVEEFKKIERIVDGKSPSRDTFAVLERIRYIAVKVLRSSGCSHSSKRKTQGA